MSIRKQCGVCKRKKVFVKRRIFEARGIGYITSQSELCGKCAKDLKKVVDTLK